MIIEIPDATVQNILLQAAREEALSAACLAAKGQLGRDIAYRALFRHQVGMGATLEALALIIKAQMPKQEAERIAA